MVEVSTIIENVCFLLADKESDPNIDALCISPTSYVGGEVYIDLSLPQAVELHDYLGVAIASVTTKRATVTGVDFGWSSP